MLNRYGRTQRSREAIQAVQRLSTCAHARGRRDDRERWVKLYAEVQKIYRECSPAAAKEMCRLALEGGPAPRTCAHARETRPYVLAFGLLEIYGQMLYLGCGPFSERW